MLLSLNFSKLSCGSLGRKFRYKVRWSLRGPRLTNLTLSPHITFTIFPSTLELSLQVKFSCCSHPDNKISFTSIRLSVYSLYPCSGNTILFLLFIALYWQLFRYIFKNKKTTQQNKTKKEKKRKGKRRLLAEFEPGASELTRPHTATTPLRMITWFGEKSHI